MIDHNYEWTVISLPESDSKHGLEKFTCKYCNYSYTQSLPPSYGLEYNLYNNTYYSVASGSSKDSVIIIPGTYSGYPITAISKEGFINKQNIISVRIYSSITSIGEKAFYGCYKLTDIALSDSITSIGEGAFRGCDKLAVVRIPGKNIQENLNGVTSIEAETFYGCHSITQIAIPDSVTNIGHQAFYHCINLTSIIIPGSVKNIGAEAFSLCTGLTSVTIGDGVTSIGSHAFFGCTGITSLIITGNTITSIGARAFYNCSGVTEITIPESVTAIKETAFGNTGIIEVTIPESVTLIEEFAFINCSELKSVTVLGETPAVLGRYVFLDTHEDMEIFVPAAALTAYKEAAGWSDLEDKIKPHTGGIEILP